MSPLRTFIVEDSAIILDNLVATLEELADVKVVGAVPDEKSALAWIEDSADAVDLIIIDIFLKSGSGLGVLRAVQEAGLSARRVVLTNYATPDIRKRCAALGGKLSVASAPGRGTEVDAMVPMPATQETPSEAMPEPHLSKSSPAAGAQS